MSEQPSFPPLPSKERFVKFNAIPRPEGWSPKSNAPYYNMFCGEQMQIAVDEMMRSREPIVYRYANFCYEDGVQGGCSRNTLYNRINQSIRYLVEKMDPNNVYLRWLETVDVNRKKGLGITIRFKPEFKNPNVTSSFVPDKYIEPEDEVKWRRKMEEWLEGDEMTPFCLEKLALTTEEVESLRKELTSLSGIQASVNSTSIMIIRI